eukprot:scaffold39969_cov20-Tisochrysis_lutea.AAC.1
MKSSAHALKFEALHAWRYGDPSQRTACINWAGCAGIWAGMHVGRLRRHLGRYAHRQAAQASQLEAPAVHLQHCAPFPPPSLTAQGAHARQKEPQKPEH